MEVDILWESHTRDLKIVLFQNWDLLLQDRMFILKRVLES